MRFFGYPNNGLVICKDSPDYLGLAQEIAEANTLDLFKSKLAH